MAGSFTISSELMADPGNITLFGNTNVAIEQIDDGQEETSEVNTNISIFGIKGAEPLGNGLKAVFILESSLNLDDRSGSTGTLFGASRDAWAGLESEYGTVALGVQSQPFKTSTNKLDVFQRTLGDYAAVMGNVQGFNLYDTTIPNSIIYFSPKLAPRANGFGGQFQYGNDEVGAVRRDRWGAQINYTYGPLYITYAHAERQGFDVDAGGGVFVTEDLSGDKVGASYTFAENTTVSGIYEILQGDSDHSAAERDAFYLSLAHKFGNNVFKLAYANADDSERENADDGADFFAIGLSHNFSKRTEVYTLYARTSNDDDGRYGIGQTGSSGATRAISPGDDVDGFALGVRHSF